MEPVAASRLVRHGVVDQQRHDGADNRTEKPGRLNGALIEVFPEDAQPRKPPTNEPTMPSMIVAPMPMGSRPGTRRRAMNPAIAPTMTITTINPNMTFSTSKFGTVAVDVVAYPRGAVG